MVKKKKKKSNHGRKKLVNLEKNCLRKGNDVKRNTENENEDEFDGKEKEKNQILEEESIHFSRIVGAFLFLEKFANIFISKAKENFCKLGFFQMEKVPTMFEKLSKLKEASAVNHQFVLSLLKDRLNFSGGDNMMAAAIEETYNKITAIPTPFFMDKAKSTLLQFSREWSEEGRPERASTFQLIIDEIDSRFPDLEKRKFVRVLTPGAGLGRLTFEFSVRGYWSQGNEVSYFMLIGSNFILNSTSSANQYTLYPFIFQSINVLDNRDQIRPIHVPDCLPRESLNAGGNLSMNAGDFLEVYSSQKENWDVVATCFFIDTARNIVDYIETIYNILKPDGVWVNLGPLLYHYADLKNEFSVELSWSEVRHVITTTGFNIVVCT